jgi:thioredoxin 1
MSTQVTDNDFSKEVLEHKGQVLVDFWAPWCGPCQMPAPIIDQVATEMKDKVKVVKVNVDENPQVSSQYQITGIPTVLIFNDGQLKEQIVGFRQKQEYIEAINR